jgi:hypothetical protein
MLDRQERRELIRKFGKIFIEHVRDATFTEVRNMLLGNVKNEKLATMFSMLSDQDRESILLTLENSVYVGTHGRASLRTIQKSR